MAGPVAGVPSAVAALESLDEVLVFELSRQRYALPRGDVREVVRAVTIVPLPGAPRIVEGIINLRGAVVPVLDLRARFRLPPKPLEPSDHLVAATAGERVVAVRADRVHGLVRLRPGQVEAPAGVVVAGSGTVNGVAKLTDGLVLIHDLAGFLTEAEGETLDGAMEPGPDGENRG